jgi:hypothetical protein
MRKDILGTSIDEKEEQKKLGLYTEKFFCRIKDSSSQLYTLPHNLAEDGSRAEDYKSVSSF